MHFRDEYAFLSNFYPSPIVTPGGTSWMTVEHVYQASKSLNPADWEMIRSLPTPGQAKRAGRLLILRPDWEDRKVPFMTIFVRLKFQQHPKLAERLCAIREPIVEGNHWHDNFWGDCSCFRCKEIEGRNEMGRILEACKTRV